MLWVLALALGARIGEQALAALESPGDITRVITSLDALVQAVADETKARLVVSNGVKSWCEDTISEKKHAIDSSNDAAEQAGVDLAAAEANVESSTAKVDEVKRAITAANGELSELEKKFDTQKAEYKEALKALTDARSDVQEASFLSLSHDTVVKPDVNLDKLRTLDTQLLRGASFLQLGKLTGKEATAASDAEDEMEKEKEQLDDDWAAEQKEAAGLMGAVKKELLDLSSDLESAQLTVGMVKTKAASLTREKASAERIAKREGELLVGIEANCEANAKFAAEQEEMRSEQGTKLREAIGLIKSLTRTAMVQFAAPAFVQLSAAENPAEMLALFQSADRDVTATAPVSDAPTAAPVALAQTSLDPLADIKGKIQGMLDALKAAENAEKGPADFCSTELGSNREKKMQKSNDVDMAAAEMRAAELAKQGLETTQSGATLGRNALSAERTRLDAERGTEKQRIEEESKDHDLAIEVLDKAVSLINEEFASSLIQTGGQQTSKQVDAAKVVDALTAVRDSVAAQTKAADTHFTELDSRTTSQLASLDEAVRARDQEISEAKSGAAEQADVYATAKESKQVAQAELASIVTYLENLGQQCGPSLGNTYEELKRQREEEINGLKEALKVLEGEAVPALSLSQAAVLESSKPLSATQRAAAAIGV